MNADFLSFAADIVFGVHGVFVLFIIPSCVLALIGFYRTRTTLHYLHWGSVVIMVLGTAYWGRCPLVELEEALRNAAGRPMPYEGSFTSYFLSGIVGFDVPSIVSTIGSRLAVLLTLSSLITASSGRLILFNRHPDRA